MQRLQSMHENSTEEEMKRQQRTKVMKDTTKNIRSKGGMDAENRWWRVAELLAADCKKAWLHPGEEETMQTWYVWLEKMKKEDDGRNASTKGESDDQECGRQCWASAQIHSG